MTLMERVKAAYAAFRASHTERKGEKVWLDTSDRMRRYEIFGRAYDGYQVRAANAYVSKNQAKRLKYNLHQPIVNISASYVAANEVTWKVANSEQLTQAARDIWRRSGGDSEYLMAEIRAAKLGDLCVMVRVDEAGAAFLDFVDPCCATPEFDPIDPIRLSGLTIKSMSDDSATPAYIEKWTDSHVEITVGKESPIVYDFQFEATPAVWIPNMCSGNYGFGISDTDPTLELVEEYNHMCEKQTRIFDIFGKPIPYFKGVQKREDVAFTDATRTALTLPANADAGMLQATGTPPSLEQHLDRQRNTIAEVSETPLIAFGKVDSGFANATGISLKLLLTPLLTKTGRKRAIRKPRLEYVMYLALLAEGNLLDRQDVEIIWADPAPHNETEQIQNIEAKVRIGISRKQALLELGYPPEEVDQMMEQSTEEAQAKAELAAQSFNRGGI